MYWFAWFWLFLIAFHFFSFLYLCFIKPLYFTYVDVLSFWLDHSPLRHFDVYDCLSFLFYD